jgi:acetyl-CoA carboxylase biotin carboxylase subunit
VPQVHESVLVANRGEIASRIIHTVRGLGLKAIAVYSEADAELPFVAEADEAILIGPARAAASYLDIPRIMEAARRTNARAVHPGDGFLAENAGFAREVLDAGLAWIGPPPDAIELMGDKINARNLMAAAGVPVAAGGPGQRADDLLERFEEGARQVEVQILGLADGTVLALGERDCSVQRRHQKIVEETPSPGITPGLRARMMDAAVRAGEAVGYRGAGTVECLVDPAAQDFFFLGMNTRLQAEHPITELVTGIDLVEQQLRIAAGERPSFSEVITRGHAIELRVYAEDPVRFMPSPGEIKIWEEPVGEGIRIDAGYAEGNTVTPYYDPMLAKLCVHAGDRPAALERARTAVAAFRIEGLDTNLPFLAELLDHPEFADGTYDTGIVGRMRA